MLSAKSRAEVLIADDEAISRYVLQMYLESLGYEVVAAKDGDEALATFRGAASRIGLVILDIRMPGPLLAELYDLLRQIDPSVPILYCTGISPDDPLNSEIDARGLLVVAKPFSRGNLQQAILQITKEAELRAAAGQCTARFSHPPGMGAANGQDLFEILRHSPMLSAGGIHGRAWLGPVGV